MTDFFEKVRGAGLNTGEGFLYFGEYPSTVMAGDVTLSDTTDEKGYFLGSDGSYYTSLTATPCAQGCKFHSGEKIVAGREYFFRVEPIRWRVREDGDTALLVCDGIIDARRFDEKKNVYAESEIREWLGGELFRTAFSESEREIIEESILPADVCDSTSRQTRDRVFLLSFSDCGGDVARNIRKATDFAIARGVLIRFAPGGLGGYTEENFGDGYWWLRSCIGWRNAGDTCKDCVDFFGNAGAADRVYYGRCGVVPAVRIKL